MKNKENIIWGILLIVIGIIFGLNAMGVTDINIFFRGWWTLFIILPSACGIIKNPRKIGNYIWLIIGVLILLNVRHIIELENVSNLIFPLILVLMGLGIILKDKVGVKVNEKINELNKKLNKDGLEEYYATFSGQDLNFAGQPFKGASLNSIFGGIELTLKEAEITEDVLINATSVFGGIDIIVPENVNVQVKSTAIFGGTDNKVKKEKENVPTVYVKAFCLFGGAEIK